MRTLWNSALLFALSIGAAQAAIVAKELDYVVDGVTMQGYLAYDDAIKGQRPGVLVVHEWWGHDDYARKRARMLAELGYTALALDMYGEGKHVHHPNDANKLSSELTANHAMVKARFQAAFDALQKQPTVDPKRIAAIGYCMGGSVVLEMARSGMPLAGVVSFHGNLATTNPAQAGSIKGGVLVLTGADDPFVPAEQVTQFKQEMDAAKVDYQLIAYPGAQHSFTNPEADKRGKEFNIPLAYNAEADKASWQEMQNFFGKIFK